VDADAGLYEMVPGLVTYDDATYTANFTPEVTLKYGKDYIANLSNLITDEDGNQLPETHSWKFTTERLICDVTLNEGWNLISIPYLVESDNTTPVVLLSAIIENLDVLWSYDACSVNWNNFATSGPPGDIDIVRDGPGYWLFMDASDTLSIEGIGLPGSSQLSSVYDFCWGWNLIGFTSLETRQADDYLAGIEFNVIYAFDADGYSIIQASDNLTLGSGYWISILEPGSISP
jgi:hypothetical protein